MNFTFVGYYTDKYRDDAAEFVASCVKFGVPVYVEYVSDRGNWLANCSFKPTFIGRCMDKINTDIIYCDVDARLLSYPTLFADIDCDIAYHKGKVWSHAVEDEVLSGTIYLRNNKISRNIVYKWSTLCNNNNREMDQVLLERSVSDDAVKKILPVEYCAIFDSPLIKDKQVVISHLQHSRQRRHER